MQALMNFLSRFLNAAKDAFNVQLSGSKPQEPFSGSATVTHTFTKSMNGFGITNDGTGDLTFTIGSDTFTVKTNETWEYPVDVFTQVTITTTVAYRAWGLM